jgi:hypothetical protein
LKNAAATFRMALAGAIALSWLVLVVMMWRAYHTLPSAEALADARAVRPPLPADFLFHGAQSFAVAVLLIAGLWPRAARRYILRVTTGLCALVAWFLITVPLDLNTMEWLHRRWLALIILLLLLTLMVYPLLTRRPTRETQG